MSGLPPGATLLLMYKILHVPQLKILSATIRTAWHHVWLEAEETERLLNNGSYDRVQKKLSKAGALHYIHIIGSPKELCGE